MHLNLEQEERREWKRRRMGQDRDRVKGKQKLKEIEQVPEKLNFLKVKEDVNWQLLKNFGESKKQQFSQYFIYLGMLIQQVITI